MSDPNTTPYAEATFAIAGGSLLLSEADGSLLNVLPDSFIAVNFMDDTVDIELNLQNTSLSGMLTGTEIALSDFWDQNIISLTGSDDFSIHGGEIVGAFAGSSFQALMSIISTRSNLDEVFRGSVIWEIDSTVPNAL